MSEAMAQFGAAGDEEQAPRRRAMASGDAGGAVYGLGLIGALVYYWRRADGVGQHAMALPKAMVWPAFVVHGLLRHLDG